MRPPGAAPILVETAPEAVRMERIASCQVVGRLVSGDDVERAVTSAVGLVVALMARAPWSCLPDWRRETLLAVARRAAAVSAERWEGRRARP